MGQKLLVISGLLPNGEEIGLGRFQGTEEDVNLGATELLRVVEGVFQHGATGTFTINPSPVSDSTRVINISKFVSISFTIRNVSHAQ